MYIISWYKSLKKIEKKEKEILKRHPSFVWIIWIQNFLEEFHTNTNWSVTIDWQMIFAFYLLGGMKRKIDKKKWIKYILYLVRRTRIQEGFRRIPPDHPFSFTVFNIIPLLMEWFMHTFYFFVIFNAFDLDRLTLILPFCLIVKQLKGSREGWIRGKESIISFVS